MAETPFVVCQKCGFSEGPGCQVDGCPIPVEKLKRALARRDALLRKWLNEGLSVSGAPSELVEATETELGDSHD